MKRCYLTEQEQDAALSQGGPRDAAVHFDTYRILQRHRAVSLSQHAFLVGQCQSINVNHKMFNVAKIA